MKKQICVNALDGENRVAVLEEGQLVELYIERRGQGERVAGNIYKGRVENVLPGMEAAFVDIGLERNAFLHVDDAIPLLNGDTPKRRARIRDILKPGQEVIVQVTKDPIGTKGARIVADVSIPGRYLVLMPTVKYVGVSRRIEDEKERERLKELAESLQPEGMGLIVRTAGEKKRKRELLQDVRFLERVWKRLQRKAANEKAPCCLYEDYDLVYRMVRDHFDQDVRRFLVDNPVKYTEALEIAGALSPTLKRRVKQYRGEEPLFEHLEIESEIEKALRRKVWLDSGGYLVIDQTEALISIDVNTGKFTGGKNLADTVLRTNLEAAAEIARQMRLRNLGGIIIVDFIDMEKDDEQEQVMARLKEEFKKDRTKVNVLGFTHLGLVEITRKKTRDNLMDVMMKECPYCHGDGRVLSEETIAYRIQRELTRLVLESKGEAILIEVNPAVAALIIGGGGDNLKRLEETFGRPIYVKGVADLHLEDVHVILAGTKEELMNRSLPVREGETLEVEVLDQHQTNPKDGIARIQGYVIDIEGAGKLVGQKIMVRISKIFRTYSKAKLVEKN